MDATNSRVLVTGANGFVGRAMCRHLIAAGYEVVPAVRLAGDLPNAIAVGDINGATDWHKAVASCQTVVHLAARTHILDAVENTKVDLFRQVNTAGTLNLATAASGAGVRRFVFVSSVKVNGEETPKGRPFTALDQPCPRDAYAISKWEAEQGLHELADRTGMELVVIRPPLVYGPGVGANFRTLMRWVSKGIPLPLAAIRNKRSLIALDNLIDFIGVCLVHPSAANETLLVSDGEDLSTTEMLERTAAALGQPSRLFEVPDGLLRAAAMLFRRRDAMRRLLGSLQVDKCKATDLLGWTPPVSVDVALKKTVRAYLDERLGASSNS